MAPVTGTGCINHPGVEAVARCKQCGKPVCGTCRVSGPTGAFCSDACKEKHEAFVARAQKLETKKSGMAGLFSKLKFFLVKAVVFAVALAALGFVAIYFQIPVLGAIASRVWMAISGYIPFL